jgi:hypothetical protein
MKAMISREHLFPLFPLAALVLLWGVIFAVLPPNQQEFPLNDDWAYSKGAFAFTRGEGIHYYRQSSMPLLGQWILCYPVIRVAGQSHAALRMTTITFGLLGTLALYNLLRREAEFSPGEASFAAATFALNPLFFLMSGTFMSDVPALALSLAALDFYARALRSTRLGWLLAGAAMASLGVMTRQNAIMTPIAAGLLLGKDRTLRRHPAWLLGIIIPVAIGISANSWFAARPDAVPVGPTLPTVKRVVVLIVAGLLYLGLSILPILAFRPGVVARRRFVLALIAMAGGAYVCLMFGRALFTNYDYHRGMLPYLENIITLWGTLESGNYVVGDRPLMIGRGGQVLLTLAGCVGGAALLDRWAARRDRRIFASPVILYSALHALLLLVSPKLYDRYLLVFMPGALAIAGASHFRSHWKAGLLMLTLFAICSVGLMHDWLAWNSARWELGRRALARGISVAAIEGGLEWDSWYAPGGIAPEGPLPPPRGLMLLFNRGRLPHITGKYALAFSKPDGTVVLDSQSYSLWLVPGEREFLFLARE